MARPFIPIEPSCKNTMAGPTELAMSTATATAAASTFANADDAGAARRSKRSGGGGGGGGIPCYDFFVNRSGTIDSATTRVGYEE
jgi:hypothetical protein